MSNRLKRIAPALREADIEYEERPQGRQKKRVKTLRKKLQKTVRAVRTDPKEEKDPQKGASVCGRFAGDADDGSLFADDPARPHRPRETHVKAGNGGDADGADDDLRPFSKSGWVKGEI